MKKKSSTLVAASRADLYLNAHQHRNPVIGAVEEFAYDVAGCVACFTHEEDRTVSEEIFVDGRLATAILFSNNHATSVRRFHPDAQTASFRQYRGEPNAYGKNYPAGAQFDMAPDGTLQAAEFVEGLGHTNILRVQHLYQLFLQQKQALLGLDENEEKVLAGLTALQQPTGNAPPAINYDLF